MKYTVSKAFRPKGSNSPEAKVGSSLELSDSQARVFKAVGFVKDSDPPPPSPPPVEYKPRTYMRRDLVAESPAAPVESAAKDDDESDEAGKKVPAKKTTRSYQRRTFE